MTSTREQFIQATCELLELQGYYGTGLNQIIQESGAPKGSLYYHFPGGKEELTAESLEYVGQIVLKRIRENLAAVDDPAEAMKRFIRYIAVNVEASDFRAGGPITTVALETAASNERLRETCNQIYDAWQDAFAERLMQNNIEESRARRLAVVIISALEGGIILCRTSRSKAPLEGIAEEIAHLVYLAL